MAYTVKEGERNVVMNLSLSLSAFPPPSFYKWTKPAAYVTLNNSAISFDNITRKHAGVYTLMATNYHLNDSSSMIGTDTGNFSLDVVCKFSLILGLFSLRLILIYSNRWPRDAKE